MSSAALFRAEIHRLFVSNTTDPSIVTAMCRAHDAQMRRNARIKRKARKVYEGQIKLA